MEEGEQEEQVETAKIQATSPDQEEREQAESKISDETDLEAEAAKKNERTRKKHDEKRPSSAKERDTKEEVLKGGMDKEPSKKAPVSSFFGEQHLHGSVLLQLLWKLVFICAASLSQQLPEKLL